MSASIAEQCLVSIGVVSILIAGVNIRDELSCASDSPGIEIIEKHSLVRDLLDFHSSYRKLPAENSK
jgi:hypothetical protein